MLSLGLGLGLTSRGPFSPLHLSDLQLFVDPSDISTLFQDAAGTTPVTSDGDPVRLVLDKSGNGNNLTAPSDAARPVYKTDGTYHWLEFDGVDDELATSGPLPFSTSLFNCTAFRQNAWNSSFPEIVSNRGPSLVASQRHPMLFLQQSSVEIGSNIAPNNMYDIGSLLGVDIVTSMLADGMDREYNNNGSVASNSDGPVPTDGSTVSFRISGGNHMQGRVYGSVQANSVPTAAQIAATRQWFANRSGGIS